MIPMKHSTIFKSRWMALLWAAGIIWIALDVGSAGSPPAKSADKSDETGLTDPTGHKVTHADEEALKKALKQL